MNVIKSGETFITVVECIKVSADNKHEYVKKGNYYYHGKCSMFACSPVSLNIFGPEARASFNTLIFLVCDKLKCYDHFFEMVKVSAIFLDCSNEKKIGSTNDFSYEVE